ncbi:MAG: hypothetical protein GXY83_09125 [Rhodopirellula sp.]|nr:hypothetical protein [Rhodopirellula sp.]
MWFTIGGDPSAQARQKKYGVRPSELLPPQKKRLLALEFEKNSRSDVSL